MQATLKLNKPQFEFISHPKKFSAFVGGYRSGKTFVGCVRLCINALEHPGIPQGYFAPTYPQIADIFYDTIPDVAEAFGLFADIVPSNKRVHLRDSKGRCLSTIVCKSMEHPGRIVGFNIAHALVDEIDCMPIKKADSAWKKIIARMSTVWPTRGENTIDVTTTPEGFNWVYRKFVKELAANPAQRPLYGIVHASTRQNAKNLPKDYIPSLRESYPANLVDAYIDGQFVNLTSGTVYHTYDRKLNGSKETVQPGEPVFIGMDFNVGKMAAVTHVKRLGLPHAVDELMDGYDTPDMIRRIKERYWLYDGKDYSKTREILIYPDASGDGRRSVNASTTDLQLLKQAGFKVMAPNANPPVKDRINTMNAMFCNADGERRYRVNADLCPSYADCLEQQIWGVSGEPDKSQGADHANDAAGYFIHREYPIKRPTAGTRRIRGLT